MSPPGALVVDVSAANHPNGADLPWDALAAAGVEGIIAKLTEGGQRSGPRVTGYLNQFAEPDISGARRLGKGVAAYHFVRAADSVDAQHEWIRENLAALEENTGAEIRTLFLSVAPEGFDSLSPTQAAKTAYALAEFFPAGAFPIVGICADLPTLAMMAGAPWHHPLWLGDPAHPNAPVMSCLVHQYGQAQIGGVWFDMNRFLGTPEQFSTLFDTAPATPAGVPE